MHTNYRCTCGQEPCPYADKAARNPTIGWRGPDGVVHRLEPVTEAAFECRCQECGYEWESATIFECPACGSPLVARRHS